MTNLFLKMYKYNNKEITVFVKENGEFICKCDELNIRMVDRNLLKIEDSMRDKIDSALVDDPHTWEELADGIAAYVNQGNTGYWIHPSNVRKLVERFLKNTQKD